MAELTCTGVAKAFGERQVLVDVDLEVPESTLTAILGASGSGKTTLLRVVMGFLPADRGSCESGTRSSSIGGAHSSRRTGGRSATWPRRERSFRT